jgi:hypothetical protein
MLALSDISVIRVTAHVVLVDLAYELVGFIWIDFPQK